MEKIYSQLSPLEGELNSTSFQCLDPETRYKSEVLKSQKLLQFERISNRRKTYGQEYF
jgi:hypothetical protein